MKIRRLSAKNFGKFEDYAIDFDSNIAVIRGQNEAGKSTIFDMIKILLFGLGEDSSKNERKSFIRYGASEAFISGEFERADGSPLSLSRKITGESCELNINENFDFKNLGSDTAPIVSHLTKEVYENIYALDFHTMSTIRDDVWQGIKDEFMGADMAQELVSASDAIETANNKANTLYARDGAPSVLSDLKKEHTGLEEKLETANKAQDNASNNYIDLETSQREVTDKQNKIEFENAFLVEAEKMNILKADISRIRSLAQDAGDLSAYKKWLPNIKEEFDSLRNETESTNELLMQARSITQDEPSRSEAIQTAEFDDFFAKVLEHQETIESLHHEVPDVVVKKEEEYVNDDYAQANANWHTQLREILIIDADENQTMTALDNIDSITLSTKLDEYIQKKDKLNAEIKKSNVPVKKGGRTFMFVLTLIISILAILVGATIFTSEFLSGVLSPSIITHYWFDIIIKLVNMIPLSKLIVADLLCGIGLILLIVDLVFIKGKSKRALYKMRDENIKQAREDIEKYRIDFEEELHGLAFPKLRIKKPGLRIIEDIESLKQAKKSFLDTEKSQQGFEDTNYETQVHNELADNTNDDINNLANILLDMPSSNTHDNYLALRSLLRAATDAKAQYDKEAINAPIEHEESTTSAESSLIAELEQKSGIAKEKFDELSHLLGDNPETAIVDIQNRYDMLNKAVVLRDEILTKYPDFKEVTDRLSQLDQAGWPYTDNAMAAAKERVDELRQDISTIQSKIGLMENGVKQAILGENPSDIASEIIRLAEKIRNVETDHDKLRISEEVIKLGNDVFSKLHQPEVLSRAGYYLSILTGGKYSEIKLSEDTSAIMVMTEEEKFRTPHASRLSQATCEQIYLSIRLAVIKSFDKDTEVMPVTLDEALITWDSERLTAGIDLLAQIARKRQVLIFTCHDFIVDIFKENQPTAQIVEI
ncbi:MAG: AAA family ATPase [Clostridiales bacterium]|nr:AAA family ATPase [Clostridiales bacterium]